MLLCLIVCLTLLASFFLPSFISHKKNIPVLHVYMCTCNMYIVHFVLNLVLGSWELGRFQFAKFSSLAEIPRLCSPTVKHQ